ncbi:MAG: type II toxin-antitoxin system HicB family antitoxin [Fimbriimonadaceae bacterium]
MKEYAVVFERGERNWSAYVPDLPGCVAAADTRAGIEQLIREAIEFHIEGLRLQGDPVPEPVSEAQNVRVSA